MVRYSTVPGVRRACCVGALALWLVPPALVGGEVLRTRTANAQPQAVAADPEFDPALFKSLTVLRPGTSTALARKQAVAELTLNDLSSEARAKAEHVLQHMGLYRRLPVLAFDVEPSVYHYLLQHPDVAVSTWRAMEISKFELQPLGGNVYHADAGDGSVGRIEVWRSTRDDTIIYCDGAFKSPLVPKPIVARAIMRLRTRVTETAEGAQRAECSGDVFVEFPSQTVETIARVISPISYSIADRNFKQLSLYAHLMSQAMTRQPGWIRSLARQMDATDAQKAELLELTEQVHEAAFRRAEARREPMPLDAIITPLKLPAEGAAVVPASGLR